MRDLLSTLSGRRRAYRAPSGMSWWGSASIFLACGAWCSMATAQMMQRPSTVWGDLPVEQEGFVVGGVEVLTAMLLVLAVSGALGGLVLLRALGLLQRARRAEGAELEFIWLRTQTAQKWASFIAFGLLPITVVPTLLLAPYRTLFGFGISELAMALFLAGCVVGGSTFLVLEAVRRTLGAERV